MKRAVALGAGATTAALLLTVAPAHASTSTNPIVFAGSETTESFDNQLVIAEGGAGSFVYNVPVLPTSPVNVPAAIGGPLSENTSAITYVSPPAAAGQVVAPNGSSAGINAVAGTTAAIPLNSVDVGRSSRDYLANLVNSGAGDPAGLEFWAYAKDALTWSTKSLQAPAAMTITQLRQIYQVPSVVANAATPAITNWNQIPGAGNGAITRYLPQNNSGTRLSFVIKMLRPAATDPGPQDAFYTALPTFEENRGVLLPQADRETAVYPYSVGKWIYQYGFRANPAIDTRDGTKLGSLYTASTEPGAIASANSPTGFVQRPTVYNPTSGAYAINAAVVTDANATPGTTADGIGARYLYHVLNGNVTAGVNVVSYNAARSIVGSGSPLDAGTRATLIRSEGFVPLTVTGGTGGTRLFSTPVSY